MIPLRFFEISYKYCQSLLRQKLCWDSNLGHNVTGLFKSNALTTTLLRQNTRNVDKQRVKSAFNRGKCLKF